VLRLPMIYGPGDRLHRLHALLRRMHDRRPAIVMQDSVARWRAPRGYVEKVAAAIALAATDPRVAGRVYNVAESESYTELEWARRIARAVRWDGPFVTAPADELPPTLSRPGNLAQHWVVSSERIRRELDYREPVDFDEALRRTIAWETANPPATPIGPPLDYAAEDAVIAAHRSAD
jgi:nucleoside-diphosphate-sugar epimerase